MTDTNDTTDTMAPYSWRSPEGDVLDGATEGDLQQAIAEYLDGLTTSVETGLASGPGDTLFTVQVEHVVRLLPTPAVVPTEADRARWFDRLAKLVDDDALVDATGATRDDSPALCDECGGNGRSGWSECGSCGGSGRAPWSAYGVSRQASDPAPDITAATCERYVIVQRSEDDVCYYDHPRNELAAAIIDRADEDDWWISEVIDLETGQRVSYEMRATLTFPS